MRKLPALARCRCLQAMQIRLDALLTQEIHELCEAAVKLCEEMQVLTWRAAATRLFFLADPCQYVATAEVVGGDEGQQASLQLPQSVIMIMQDIPLPHLRAWYANQYNALVAGFASANPEDPQTLPPLGSGS